MKEIKLNNYIISNNQPFTLIAGPCQIEDYDHSMMMAEKVKNICDELSVNLIYKSSFDKANRTSINGKRGIGLEKSIKIIRDGDGIATITREEAMLYLNPRLVKM